MEEVINYGWLSLIPAVVAVVLAFATRNVVLSLAISLFLIFNVYNFSGMKNLQQRAVFRT